MNSSYIKYFYSINEYPNIIITTEIKHHIFIINFTVLRLIKCHIDIHPKP